MFAFYDFETTGTSPQFDQPIQFAAILTDENLNEIERVNIRCRLSPHIIPAPWALAVTGVTPAQLTDPTLPSWFEFTQQLREIINRWGPATWTGYNSLAFDEQFFRQSFYQCLLPYRRRSDRSTFPHLSKGRLTDFHEWTYPNLHQLDGCYRIFLSSALVRGQKMGFS